MSYFDVILILIVLAGVYIGYKRGCVNSFWTLLKWGGSFIGALLLYPYVMQMLNNVFEIEQEWQRPLSFTAMFISLFLLLSFLLSEVKARLAPSVEKDGTNKFCGILPGFFTGVITAIIVTKLMFASLWKDAVDDAKQGFLAPSFDNSVGWIDNRLDIIFNAPVTEQHIASAYESNDTINEAADFKTSEFEARHDLEEKMLLLVNAERQRNGLKILKADKEMYNAASVHAADMFVRGYFSHNTPEGSNPFDRMSRLNIQYRYAGENLAHAADMALGHKGLMNSPGHKANILNAKFGRIGIAILDGGDNGLMIVQEFRD